MINIQEYERSETVSQAENSQTLFKPFVPFCSDNLNFIQE